ncbi:hypothetical protein HAALTHF_01390n [Vreelandella aquamarina]|nr:hypothetical protein HAALTHF_01390n [Halomonas axialensis]
MLDDANDAEWLQQALAPTGIDTKVLSGPEALCDVASVPEVDTVMAAIVGPQAFCQRWRRQRQANACCWPIKRRWS